MDGAGERAGPLEKFSRSEGLLRGAERPDGVEPGGVPFDGDGDGGVGVAGTRRNNTVLAMRVAKPVPERKNITKPTEQTCILESNRTNMSNILFRWKHT